MSAEEKTEINNETKKENDKKKIMFDGRGIAAICAGFGGALTVLRIYQMLKITDFETGFFTAPKSATVNPFYFLCIMFVLLAVALIPFADTPLRTRFPVKRDIAHGAACALLCVGCGESAIAGFRLFFEKVGESMTTPLGYLAESRAYSELLSPVFALLAALVSAVAAVSAFTGKPVASKLRILHLFPALWLFTVTIKYFAITANYLKEPQLMMLIFATVFFMLFMFEYARFACGIASKSSKKIYMSSGAVSVGLFAAILIPELLAGIFVEDYSGVANADFAWWQAAAPIFALSALRLRIGTDETEENVIGILPSAENAEKSVENAEKSAENAEKFAGNAATSAENAETSADTITE